MDTDAIDVVRRARDYVDASLKGEAARDFDVRPEHLAIHVNAVAARLAELAPHPEAARLDEDLAEMRGRD